MFLVDPSVTGKANGAVTKLIPIPLEWAPMLIDGPNFGTAFRRVFDLFDSLDEDDRSDLYPILEMIGMACCAADNSDMAPSTLSTQWTRLTYHARTKQFVIGHKGDCTNFALLGRCSESCPYKHVARPVADERARAVKEALELGLRKMATKNPA